MTIPVVGSTSTEDRREAWYPARRNSTTFGSSCRKARRSDLRRWYGDVFGTTLCRQGYGIGLDGLTDVAEDVKRRLLKVPM